MQLDNFIFLKLQNINKEKYVISVLEHMWPSFHLFKLGLINFEIELIIKILNY